jgi:hypothetical protein
MKCQPRIALPSITPVLLADLSRGGRGGYNTHGGEIFLFVGTRKHILNPVYELNPHILTAKTRSWRNGKGEGGTLFLQRPGYGSGESVVADEVNPLPTHQEE